LPKALVGLNDLAHNLWWSWNLDAQGLFIYLDAELWDDVKHNPVRFLNEISRTRLNAAMRDHRFMDLYAKVMQKFESYLKGEGTWYSQTFPQQKKDVIAYFSPEFGLHESLPIYAGGLGILSGDHTKEASDLGLPFVGIGFIYQQGYFRQRISEDGWQIEYWDNVDHKLQPVVHALDEAGNDVIIEVGLPGRTIKVQVWRLAVGRVPLF
jgi:starch phosphorylase